ncbi:nft-1 [Pristionchus pacificus]|uniref:bis(5'-adenosyl)-triphosphatase n=1 Tax=Pristionchus pacificus TaxID=54126 RepID=A0A2A6CBF3_PRIPA|nr:nft-1 [Pristionchus pacificus]|eukprot:PDM75430.1 nft-1 [Pristionchus pacificus]
MPISVLMNRSGPHQCMQCARLLISRAMASTTSARSPALIGVCQMTNSNDMEVNWKVAQGFIERAVERKCKMLFFPECFDFVGVQKEDQITMAFDESDSFLTRFRDAAKQHGLWMSLGGFHNKDPSGSLPWNSHIVIDSSGETRARYDKLHLFDLEIPGKVRLMESEFSKAGKENVELHNKVDIYCALHQMVPPVSTPIGNLGLSICYDLRFPELSIWNRKAGAHILSFPSGFTLTTGLAHWESLLRARAIENQCYVVAAAQTGVHNPKRSSYGHAMVVDPWGAVIGQCSEREIRKTQPVFAHRRSDLYSLHVNERREIGNESLPFGKFPIPPSQIFYRSAHSYAFVNLKPVLDGHVLVAPCKQVDRLTDLTDEETADLFCLAKKVQKMLEAQHGVDSSTICVQDGPQSGQTIKHVHVHILPRRKGDFGGSTDTVYAELAKHDRDDRPPRTNEQMSVEAARYRKIMNE